MAQAGYVTAPTLPNTWGSMPGANAGPQAWMQWASNAGQQATAANQGLGANFASGSNANLSRFIGQSNRAMGNLRGTNRANIRSIDRRFEAESGQMLKNLIDSGLGNSTIRGSMSSGLTRAHADAISGSRAAFGKLKFDAAMDVAKSQSALSQQNLNTLFQGTNIGYPDMGALAAMFGQSGGGGGGGGGGSSVVYDPSRPVGGPQPAWAFYGGGQADPGVGGGYDPSFYGNANTSNVPTTGQYAQGQADQYNLAALYADPLF